MDILEIASTLARTMYTSEFCSNCGGAIAIDDAKFLDPAADGENKARVHENCSPKKTTEKTWTYQANQA